MDKVNLKIIILLLVSQNLYAADPQTSSTFKVQAKIEKGCSIGSADQTLDYGRHSSLSEERVVNSIINSDSTWNIKCTEKLPITVSIDGGENINNNVRRMKHSALDEYVGYILYSSNDLTSEYVVGNTYALNSTDELNPMLNFSIYGLVDLNNNKEKSAGIYKDTISIVLTW